MCGHFQKSPLWVHRRVTKGEFRSQRASSRSPAWMQLTLVTSKACLSPCAPARAAGGQDGLVDGKVLTKLDRAPRAQGWQDCNSHTRGQGNGPS